MISSTSRTREWIDSCRKGLDADLTEKMILAFILAEELSIIGLDFIFKGGTSVSLITKVLKRFSIDLDIIVKPNTNIETFLQKLTGKQNFTHWNEAIRDRKDQIPARHFRIFYNAINGVEKYILLDVLFEENPYPQIVRVSVDSPLLFLDGEVIEVNCPTAESILGDKLTAFAPHTTGIKFKNMKELEFVKQLFDINTLFDFCVSDGKSFKQTFDSHSSISTKELEYRNITDKSTTEVLEDTFLTSCMIGTYGKIGDMSEFTEVSTGIARFKFYSYPTGAFSTEKLIHCASKAAYLSSLGLSKMFEYEKFSEDLPVIRELIKNPAFSKLNKVRNIGAEPYFYFFKALEKIGKIA